MELMEGDISDHIKKVDMRLLAFDVITAIAFLHSQQPPVLHRDIKPANVLVTNLLCGEKKGGDSYPLFYLHQHLFLADEV